MNNLPKIGFLNTPQNSFEIPIFSILFFILLSYFFVKKRPLKNKKKNAKKDENQKYMEHHGSPRFGNMKKKYRFYSDKWSFYDDGKEYKIDYDGVLIDELGTPSRFFWGGIEIDTEQVNRDYNNTEKRQGQK